MMMMMIALDWLGLSIRVTIRKTRATLQIWGWDAITRIDVTQSPNNHVLSLQF